ncbi:MarR family winged helix-turn-helix transcriptional regulator [Rhizobium sp. RAF56]|jgi:MarR family transcriptional regulator for hemolysin|uniref:MarR family winged helix-turn-helix transcriptional regulator n=1 Tax=Rhizobium sp. RAF56 TaxID=3233062 RepID=UPI003F9508BE
MSRAPTSRELFDELSAFHRKLRASFDALVRERGMTLARARVFFALSKRDGINQRELADELELETPTLVRILDAMEGQSFIERRSTQADRRAKQIHITEPGRVVAAEIDALATDVRASIVKDISDKELAVALKVIRAMAANLQTVVKG